MKTNSKTKSNSKVGPSEVQITNYKTGILSISVLSGTKQGEKDKIHVEFAFFSCFIP